MHVPRLVLAVATAGALVACGSQDTGEPGGTTGTSPTAGDEDRASSGARSGPERSGSSLSSEAQLLEQQQQARPGSGSADGAPGGEPPAGGARGPGGEPPAGGAPAPGTSAGQQQAQAALERAVNEANKAAEGDGSTCEKAYRSTNALVETLRDEGMVRDDAELASRGSFVSACEELPSEMQQCMLVGYAQSHPRECVQARNELDPETIEKIRDMMGPSAQP